MPLRKKVCRRRGRIKGTCFSNTPTLLALMAKAGQSLLLAFAQEARADVAAQHIDTTADADENKRKEEKPRDAPLETLHITPPDIT